MMRMWRNGGGAGGGTDAGKRAPAAALPDASERPPAAPVAIAGPLLRAPATTDAAAAAIAAGSVDVRCVRASACTTGCGDDPAAANKAAPPLPDTEPALAPRGSAPSIARFDSMDVPISRPAPALSLAPPAKPYPKPKPKPAAGDPLPPPGAAAPPSAIGDGDSACSKLSRRMLVHRQPPATGVMPVLRPSMT